MNGIGRAFAIVNILKAVNVLEFEGKDFLCHPNGLKNMKEELLEELQTLLVKMDGVQ